jgi:hypothetical protein
MILEERDRERGEKDVTANETCVSIFFTTSPETFLILRRTERDMIKTGSFQADRRDGGNSHFSQFYKCT